MRWLKNWIYGKTPREIPEEPKPEPKPELDDWTPACGEWEEVMLCHCGHQRETFFSDVCPKCGHKGKWFARVQRSTWEESPSRPCVHWGTDRSSMGFISRYKGFERRNYGIEVWDESKCAVES